ncbi:MAG: hypothetical protein ACRD1L_09565 [Terriglobales bacterium]
MDYLIADEFYRPYSDPAPCPRDRIDPQGRCVSGGFYRIQLPHPAAPGEPDNLAIKAAASQYANFGFGRSVTGIISLANVAVIYADGAMAGAPSVLNQLMLERRRALVDERQDLQILTRATAAPATDWAMLAGKFQRRAEAHDKLLGPVGVGGANGSPNYGVARDRYCRDVAEAIRPGAQQDGLQGAEMMIITLQRDIVQLEQSKPTLAVAGGR